jgi:hypothetical protein
VTRTDLQAPPESPASPSPPAATAPPTLSTPPAPASLSTLSTPASVATRDLAVESELRIARLEGRVAALEAALERRSNELRQLQLHLCPRDLAQWARLSAGLPPLPPIACEPSLWRETRELTEADVPETLAALWSSLYPATPPGSAGPAGLAGPPGPPASAGAPGPSATAGPPAPPQTPPAPRSAAP